VLKRTRIKEQTPSQVTYYKFIVLNQAGLANIRYNNTRECNLVAIKRLIKVCKRLLRRIKPFTSDYVISIKEINFKNNNLVIIYKRIDVSL
jgi:NADH:ubiquinone oxidoreductase subunit E